MLIYSAGRGWHSLLVWDSCGLLRKAGALWTGHTGHRQRSEGVLWPELARRSCGVGLFAGWPFRLGWIARLSKADLGPPAAWLDTHRLLFYPFLVLLLWSFSLQVYNRAPGIDDCSGCWVGRGLVWCAVGRGALGCSREGLQVSDQRLPQDVPWVPWPYDSLIFYIFWFLHILWVALKLLWHEDVKYMLKV